jgi:hypothetical protein
MRTQTEKILIRQLQSCQDELLSIGVHALLWLGRNGVMVQSRGYADSLLAKSLLRKHNFTIAGEQNHVPQK